MNKTMSKETVSKERIVIRAHDGYPLSATIFRQLDVSGQRIKSNGRVVMINSATGVPQGYYHNYATFLCEQGFIAITYDYRGIGESKLDNWQGKPLSMADWGKQDLDSVIVWAKRVFSDHRLLAISHSVGGQLIGLAMHNNSIEGVLAISSQAGYTGFWSGIEKFKFQLYTHIVIPGVTRVMGDLPGSLLGSEPLPRGVARQWARWCRHPDYMIDRQGKPMREHFDGYNNKLRLYHFTDDQMYAPLKAVEVLGSYYKNADVEVMVRQPVDYEGHSVGHFGFFKRSMPKQAWLETAEWLVNPVINKHSDQRATAA